MIGELFTKVALVPIGLIAGAEVVKGGAEGIVLAAATVGALGFLWAKVVRPARRFARRIGRGVDLLEQLPNWQAEVREHLDNHGRALDLIAETDRHRIKDALAGDKRSPVDRRAA